MQQYATASNSPSYDEYLCFVGFNARLMKALVVGHLLDPASIRLLLCLLMHLLPPYMATWDLER